MIKLVIVAAGFFLIFQSSLQAQSLEKDLDLLALSQKTISLPHLKKKQSRNPLSIGYQLGIKLYQKAISEQLATSCAFELTCSRFSSAMVAEQGFLKGYFLTFDRLSRCTKIATIESLPVRINKQGKIIESPADFHFH